MRLTLDQVQKLFTGNKHVRKTRKMLVLPVAHKDLLGTHVQLDLPIEIVCTPNLREHFGSSTKRRHTQQGVIAYWAPTLRHVRNPVAVGLVRISPGKLDGDNLQASFKAVRDAIARCYGKDDADWKAESISWTYAQMSMGKLYGVRIAVQGSLL